MSSTAGNSVELNEKRYRRRFFLRSFIGRSLEERRLDFYEILRVSANPSESPRAPTSSYEFHLFSITFYDFLLLTFVSLYFNLWSVIVSKYMSRLFPISASLLLLHNVAILNRASFIIALSPLSLRTSNSIYTGAISLNSIVEPGLSLGVVA